MNQTLASPASGTGRISTMDQCCLLCSEKCINSPLPSQINIPGALHCATLKRQLFQLFVLQKLLDIPSTWCEDKLGSDDDRGNGAKDNGLESWFTICHTCVTNWVVDAWEIQQNMLSLQTKMISIKDRLKKKMSEGIKNSLANRRTKSHIQAGVVGQIRALLFPDLIKQSTIPVVETSFNDLNDDNDDSFAGFCSNESSDSDSICFLSEIEVIPKKRSKLNSPKRNTNSNKGKSNDRITENCASLMSVAQWRRCTKCPIRFTYFEDYKNHQLAHEENEKNGDMYTCPNCGFPARSKEELEIHNNRRHVKKKKGKAKTYSCSKCAFISTTWKMLRSHYEKQHPDAIEETAELQLYCSICKRDFENRSNLIIHRKHMHPELFEELSESIPCDQCSQLFPSKIHLQYHMNKTHLRVNKVVCDICGKGFKFEKTLERHKITHEKGRRDFICHICGCDYPYESILTKHYKQFHPEESEKETNSEAASTPSTSKEEYSCKYCTLKSPHKILIYRHMLTHKAEMGHQCDICNKYYTSLQGLNRHKRINHSETNESVSCPHCNKPFSTMDYMKSHILNYCKLKNTPAKKMIRPAIADETAESTSTASLPITPAPTEESGGQQPTLQPNLQSFTTL